MAEISLRPGSRGRAFNVVPGGPDIGAPDRQPGDRQGHVHRQQRGRHEIGKIAADKLKLCSLELGGKSAAIILEDADLDSTPPTCCSPA